MEGVPLDIFQLFGLEISKLSYYIIMNLGIIIVIISLVLNEFNTKEEEKYQKKIIEKLDKIIEIIKK